MENIKTSENFKTEKLILPTLPTYCVSREGKVRNFDIKKIEKVIATISEGKKKDIILKRVKAKITAQKVNEISVERIQDIILETLEEIDYKLAKEFMKYRLNKMQKRTEGRNKKYFNLVESSSKESTDKRENANINGDSAMGIMLQLGSTISKEILKEKYINPKHMEAHEQGYIHIHDSDFYVTGTTTCCQINLRKLFKNGFNTGHGYIREPQKIETYAALAAIAIQSNQNDQHGGQSIYAFDYDMGEGVRKSLFKNLKNKLDVVLKYKFSMVNTSETPMIFWNEDLEQYKFNIAEILLSLGIPKETANPLAEEILKDSLEETKIQTFGAMESFIHNLNTMHSRAGSQVPFSSVNFGTDISWSGRMLTKALLDAQYKGLGNGETPIFPILIFKVKDGVNYKEGDPNYDLFQLAMKVSAKRLFPNFSFIDAPHNIPYYNGTPESEVSYMGCRTRVIGNVLGTETVDGRGNISFTTINLPRLAIEASEKHKTIDKRVEFFKETLVEQMELVKTQLLERLEFQGKKKKINFPFLMDGIWRNSEYLDKEEDLISVIQQGTLSIGFIGLAEAMRAIMDRPYSDSLAQQVAYSTIKLMRDVCDRFSKETILNFSLLATPAEGLSGRFVKLDREKYGVIDGVTNREYYTNSFHVPVYEPISALEKIKIEGPYHELTNAGHISYVELDGNLEDNLEAFETILRYMKQYGIGYGSINHPVDRDSICGYTGIIKDTCPKCGRKEDGTPFERIRRITGYLVGTTERFNDAKKAEEKDRLKHNYN